MQTIDLLTLIPKCHEAAKAKGFWDVTPNRSQQLMLAVSELSEALEADRKGKTTMEGCLQGMLNTTGCVPEYFAARFQANVKDTVEDELADAYIRLCDYAGGFELDIETMLLVKCDPANWALPENLGAALLLITQTICEVSQAIPGTDVSDIADAMTWIECLCIQRGIDLATHIDLKLAYNATREKRHGKAY